LRTTSWIPFVILAGFVLFWTLFTGATTPNFGGTDVFIFRDAGCNCAAHLGFVSQSSPITPASVPPVLFADYTPGTPLLFAPAARIFGCTAYTDTYFDLILLVIIAAVLILYLPREDRVIVAVLLGITLPVGIFLTQGDRPENPALALFLIFLLAWKRTQRVWLKCLLAGLAGCLFLIHPYVGITSFMLFILLLAVDRNVNGRLTILTGSSAIAAIGILAWLAALHFADPSAIHRFMEHAFGAHSGAGRVLKQGAVTGTHVGFIEGHLRVLTMYLDKSNRLRVIGLVALLCYFLVFGVALLRLGSAQRRPALIVLFALVCILFIFPLLVFPGQVSYFSASGAMLFAVAAAGGNAFSDGVGKSRALLIVLIAGAVLSFPNLAIKLLQSSESKVSYRHAEAQALRVQQMFVARGLEQPRLLINASEYFVYKPYFHYLYNAGYFQPDDSLTPFDGLVRCYMATLAFSRADLPWEKPFHEEEWELMDSDLQPVAISLLGHRLQRRDWSWSCDVYVHKREQP